MSVIDSYITKILSYTESTKSEYEDIKKELTTYLNEKKAFYLSQGHTSEGAEQQAISDFGQASDVGQSLSKSIFPQRMIAMHSLLVISVLYLLVLSTVLYFLHGAIPFIWMSIFLTFSVITAYLARRQLFLSRHRTLFMIFGFVYLFIWFFGLFYLDSITNDILLIVLRLFYLVVGLAIIVNIVLGAIFQPINKHFSKQSSERRVLIVISNTNSGIAVITNLLLMLFGWAIFGSMEEIPMIYPGLIMTLVWIGTMVLSSRLPKAAWVSAAIQLALSVYIVYDLFFRWSY